MKRPDIQFFTGDAVMADIILRVVRHIPESCNIHLAGDLHASGYQLYAASPYGVSVIDSNRHHVIRNYVERSNLIICTMSDKENNLEVEAFKFACELKKPILMLSGNYHTIDLNTWKDFSYHSKINKHNIHMVAQCREHARNIKENWDHLNHIYQLGNPMFDEIISKAGLISINQQRSAINDKINAIWIRRDQKPSLEADEQLIIQTLAILKSIGEFALYLDFDSEYDLEYMLRYSLVDNKVYNIQEYIDDPQLKYNFDMVFSSIDSNFSALLSAGLEKPVCILSINDKIEKWYKEHLNVYNVNKLIPCRTGRVIKSKNQNQLETAIKKGLKPLTRKNLLKNHEPYPKSAEKIAELITRLAY